MHPLRVATANLLHGVALPSGRVDLDAHARALAALDADVIALQEVDRGLPRSDGVDQVAALAARLGYPGVFAPALAGDPDRSWTAAADPDPGGPAYGIGLLSRRGLRAVRRLALPGGGGGWRGGRPPDGAARREPPPRGRPPSPGWDREPRAALSVLVDAGGADLAVTTTHLSYLPWRGLRQLRCVLRAAGERLPALLCGDLNLPVGLVRRAAPGWTHAGGRPTYPSWRPRLQPDQVLASPGVRLGRVEVAPGPGDHLPLVAQVRLEG